jgi:AcrR family transcriptional regulator
MARTRIVTRRQVLNLAATLFAENGYRSTSLELVAAKLGVTRQALYYHFTSKAAVLAALFEESMTKLESAVDAASADPQPPGTPRFLAMVSAHVDVTLANADLMAVLLHERTEMNKIGSLKASRRRRDYADAFIDAYDEGKAEGSLRDVDSWVAVNTTIATINSVPTWHHGSRAARPDELKSILEVLLSSGLRTH